MELEKKIRNSIASLFDENINEAMSDASTKDMFNDPFFGGLAIHACLSSTYKSLSESDELAVLCGLANLDYDEILEEELQNAQNRYLEPLTR